MTLREQVEKIWNEDSGPPSLSERMLAFGLSGLSTGWWLGSRTRSLLFDLALKKSVQVAAPVIGIGNLTVGGTGKTPLVIEIARRFQADGWTPAVVSRGYRRASNSSEALVVSDRDRILAEPAEAGDEPLMMARALPGVPVIVSARRAQAAQGAIDGCGADLILLDDGFQHRALRRNCDVVLWDTLRASEAIHLLPRGPYREGLHALRRAHALVFTRCNLGREPRRLLWRIKRIAPHLRIFYSDTLPDEIVPIANQSDRASLSPEHLKDMPVLAFCGLGNPDSFWSLLDQLGAVIAFRHAFPDHHRPRLEELRKLESEALQTGSRAILMTEKDQMNLPADWKPDLPVYVLKVRASLGEDTERFYQFLRSTIS